MEKEEVRRLLIKYREGTCTPHERAVLESWYLAHNSGDESVMPDDELEDEIGLIWENIGERVRAVDAKKSVVSWRRWIAAAAILLIVGAWSVFVFVVEDQPIHVADIPVDVEPGENRATLTLANGTSVALSNEHEGIIVSSDAFRYMDGSEIRIAEDKNHPQQITMNSISVPRGGRYRIELPDGTQVWLNASSSMRYPVSFTGAERRVSIEGEAYFEVAQDKEKPFIVEVDSHSVQVLGTSFNVSSYPEEDEARVTLVSGSVKVGASEVLKPGQQAVIRADQIAVADVDTELYTAWTANIFKFRETELRAVMGQLSRWYDIEIEYVGDIPPTYYYGQIGRDHNLSAALRILKGSGLNFEIQKTERYQKLIVYP